MLVLSRKENERILIGDDVVINVVRISGDKVRIGIEAPPETPILREELSGKTPSGERVNGQPIKLLTTSQVNAKGGSR